MIHKLLIILGLFFSMGAQFLFSVSTITMGRGELMLISSDGQNFHIEEDVIMQAGYFSSLFSSETFFDNSNKIVLESIPSSVLVDILSILKISYSMRQLSMSDDTIRDMLKKMINSLIEHKDPFYISNFLSAVYMLSIPFMGDVVEWITYFIALDLENMAGTVFSENLSEALVSRGYTNIPESLMSNIRHFFLCRRHSVARYIEKYGQPKIQGGVLDLSDKKLISVEGMGSIDHPERVFELILSDNNIIFDRNKNPASPNRPFQMFSNLEILILSSNNIKSLPNNIFADLRRLSILYLDNNLLKFLSDSLFMHLENIRAIYLDNNKIQELPAKIFNGLYYLRGLYLRNNKIKEIPEGLFNSLHNLVVLHLSNNRLLTLPRFIFSRLYNLQRLVMGSNWFTSLPEELLDGLTNLELLYLSNSKLTRLSQRFFVGASSLRRLYLHGNYLNFIGDGALCQKILR